MACGCVHYLFMSLAPSQPATSLSHRLGLTLAGLCEALAARMAKDRDAVLLLFMAWTRLRRFVFRFEALLADFRAGRLSAAPSPRGGGDNLPQLPGLAGLPQPRLPRAFGWLLRLAPESAAFAGQVEHLLADPEMKALLAGSAQASRMLLALCRMLGIQPGPELSPPPRGVPPRRGVRPRRGVEASRSDAVGPSGAGVPGGRPGDASPPGATPPASPGAPGSEAASAGSHFAGQNGGPGLGSRSGSQFASELGSRSWPAPPWRPELPRRMPADWDTDPPLNVPWHGPARD